MGGATTQRRTVSRILEGLGIVLSILLAFAIDAWWTDVQVRREVQQHLLALVGEVEAARQGFEARIEQYRTADATIGHLIGAAQAYPPNSTEFEPLFFELGPFAAYQPPQAALDDLVNSGTMAQIEDDDVRRAVAAYIRALERDLAEQTRLKDNWFNEMQPFWLEYVNLRGLIEASEPDPGSGFGLILERVPSHSPESRYGELFAQPRFENLLVNRSIYHSRIQSTHLDVVRAIDQLHKATTQPAN